MAATPYGKIITPGSGDGPYALLNGDNLAVYIDTLGDLGAVRQSSGTIKPPGAFTDNGVPTEINQDGSINPGTGYMLLYNEQDTSGSTTQYNALVAKTEYQSCGVIAMNEGWSLQVGSGNFILYSNSVWGAMATNRLVGLEADQDTGALFVGQLSSGAGATFEPGAGTAINITHEWSFNTVGNKNILTCAVSVSNVGTTTDFSVRYCRYIAPHNDVLDPGVTDQIQVGTNFSCPGNVPANNIFAINSVGLNTGRNMSLGMPYVASPLNPGGPGGATIYAISGTESESATLTNPLGQLATVNYIELHNTDPGAAYVNRTIPSNNATSLDFRQFYAGDAAGAFLNADGDSVTPTFSSVSTSTNICLLTDSVALPNVGDNTVSWTFVYVFDIPQTPTPPPPPGTGTPCAPYFTNDDLQGWEGVRHVQGLRNGGGITPGRMPCHCQPTMCLNGIATIISPNYPRVPLFGRGDNFMISTLDTLTPNVQTYCFNYETRPMMLSGSAARQDRKRASRIKAFGKGVVTDGIIKVSIDPPYGPTCTYKAWPAFMNRQEFGVLLMQELDKSMVGRIAVAQFCLNGIGLEINDAMIETTDLG